MSVTGVFYLKLSFSRWLTLLDYYGTSFEEFYHTGRCPIYLFIVHIFLKGIIFNISRLWAVLFSIFVDVLLLGL